MIDEVFRKNKTNQKIVDADERFLKISPLPDGSRVVDAKSSRIAYVADPINDKDAINKSWATKYFKEEKDAVTKLSESATAKSAEIDTKLVKFNADKASIEQTGEELKVLSAETKSRAEETKAKLESALAQLEQAKTKIDNFNTDYAKAKELKGDVEGKAVEVKANLDSVKAVLNAVTAKSEDILSTYTNAKQDLQSTGSTAKQELQGLSTSTKQEIATIKASIDTRANEALNQASMSLADIKAIVADFKGKQTELNALKASLESLKSSLENLSKSGLINDTEAGTAQTYSSSKIDNLLQGVKNESDDKYLAKSEASVDNTANTLVKRGTDKNIAVNNVKISDTGSDIEMARDIERDTQSLYQLLIRKSKNEPIKLMNLQNFIGRLMFYTQENIDKATALCLKNKDAEKTYLSKEEAKEMYTPKTNNYFTQHKLASTLINGKESEFLISGSNKQTINKLQIAAADTLALPNRPYVGYTSGSNDGGWSFVLARRDASNLSTIRTQTVADLYSFIQDTARSEINRHYVCDQDHIELFPFYVNLEISFQREGMFRMSTNIPDEMLGQRGIFLVWNANLITGWENPIKWLTTPVNLQEEEMFGYYIDLNKRLYMWRARGN